MTSVVVSHIQKNTSRLILTLTLLTWRGIVWPRILHLPGCTLDWAKPNLGFIWAVVHLSCYTGKENVGKTANGRMLALFDIYAFSHITAPSIYRHTHIYAYNDVFSILYNEPSWVLLCCSNYSLSPEGIAVMA